MANDERTVASSMPVDIPVEQAGATGTETSVEHEIREDIKPYVDAFGQDRLEDSYVDVPVEGDEHYRRYQGKLGDFVYDARNFELQIMESKYGDKMEILHYIGKETDGSKIELPQGDIKSMLGMFMGTDIKSGVVIPAGVECTSMMYANCHSLESAKVSLPPTVTDASFMYACCENLREGPKLVPGSVKNADYMLMDCVSLQNTPRFGQGVESMNGTLAYCKSLKDVPVIPNTVKQSNYTTIGCEGMDKHKDEQAAKQMQKAREKYEKKLDRPSFGARVGSMFSAVLQTHALRRMGYGAVMAPIMTHMLRKQGMLGKDLSSGVATMAMTKGGVMSHMIYRKAQENAVKKVERQAERKAEKMARWDRLYGNGTEFNRKMEASAANAERDVHRGLFRRLPTMETSQLNMYRESHGHAEIYRQQADLLESQSGANLDAVSKKQISKWFMDELSKKTTYLKEAEAAIESDTKLTASQRAESMMGLDIMREISLSPLTQTMQDLQRKHQLFNEGDCRNIDKMVQEITGRPVFGNQQQAYQTERQAVWTEVQRAAMHPSARPHVDVRGRTANEATQEAPTTSTEQVPPVNHPVENVPPEAAAASTQSRPVPPVVHPVETSVPSGAEVVGQNAGPASAGRNSVVKQNNPESPEKGEDVHARRVKAAQQISSSVRHDGHEDELVVGQFE